MAQPNCSIADDSDMTEQEANLLVGAKIVGVEASHCVLKLFLDNGNVLELYGQDSEGVGLSVQILPSD